MSSAINILIQVAIILLLVVGIAQFRTPRGARRGNATAAVALMAAIGFVLYLINQDKGLFAPAVLVVSLAVGGLVGTVIAMRVTMIQIPSMVAFQHGAGGVAACAIAYVELTRDADITPVGVVSGYLGLTIGAATFSGSMLASGKLAGKLRQTPTVFARHNAILLALLAGIVGLSIYGTATEGMNRSLALMGALFGSALLGYVFSVRIGGADMPVLISFLNATAGLAAAFCGVVIQNQLLIACGATVAASGSILTAVMCKAMNRSFVRVLAGGKMAVAALPAKKPAAEKKSEGSPAGEADKKKGEAGKKPERDAMAEAKTLLRKAKSVIIVPGYGMALARAQFQVAALCKQLEQLGKTVVFGIHPVAGRMPGHMNVLLAEADVDYDALKEMDEVNDSFSTTDLVLVIGACDVVNPAAIDIPDTPISGMPILNAHEAKNVLVCNLDEKPGYSGVPNTLYERETTLMLLGDAGATVTELLQSLSATEVESAKEKRETVADVMTKAKTLLREAKSVIIVPGYGMALARAQFQVAALSQQLESLGKTVAFGIHPVAGRMPGHMNVLLAEADIDYDALKEMDEINDSFSTTDLVLVIGACDVVNPAAIDMPDTPISGMPILKAHEAKNVLVCNLDEKPGYSGVPNTLYEEETTLLLFGDANATVTELLESLSANAEVQIARAS
jgi:NAD(P) transhydrogenase subunit beta